MLMSSNRLTSYNVCYTKLLRIRTNIRHYEQGIVRMMRLNNSLALESKSLNRLSSELLNNSKIISEVQATQLASWNDIILNVLVFLVIMAILGGVVILIFFIHSITSDEQRRLVNEMANENNRRLLDNIINNSKSLIYVKDIDRKYTLVNQNWCKHVITSYSIHYTKLYDNSFVESKPQAAKISSYNFV